MKFINSIFYKLIILAFSIICTRLSSQNQFKSLNSDNGLPSNTIYNVFQDSKGYVWIGTDNGLCRWDSKNFKTFTIADGLPNNEVYFIVEDTEGKIWFSTFSTELCYYKNDTIFNQKNDKRLKDIKIVKAGQIIKYQNDIYYLKNDNLCLSKFNTNILKTNEILHTKNRIASDRFSFVQDYLCFYKTYKFNDITSLVIYTNNEKFIFKGWNFEPINDTIFKIIDYNDNQCYILKIKNIYSFIKKYGKNISKNLLSSERDYRDYLMKKQVEQKIIIDSNINILYSSIFKKGLEYFFRLKNESIFVYKNQFISSNFQNSNFNFEINNIKKVNENLYIYTPKGLKIYTNSFIEQINNPFLDNNIIHKLFQNQDNYVLMDNYFKLNLNKNIKSRVDVNSKLYNISNDQYNNPCITSSNKIVDLSNNQKIESNLFDNYSKLFKGFYFSKEFNIYIINNGNLGFFKQSLDKKIKKISNKTAYTSFIDSKKRLWMGSVNKMYVSKNFLDSVRDEYEIKLNKNFDLFCSEIQEDNSGNLFFSTNDGVYILDKNNVKYHLNNSNYLSSNEIKTIKLDTFNHSLFIATTNGLNQIRYKFLNHKLKFEVVNKFFKSDGLSSNEIKDVLINRDSIWVATPNGLDLISNSQYKPDSTSIQIYFNAFFVNDSHVNYNSFKSLSHDQNNIKIEYSAIYFSRRDRLNCFYNLINGNDTLRGQITEDNLQFLSLEPAQYRLQIVAYDKDYPYIKGYSQELKFEIKKPYYKTWWFFILVLLVPFILVSSIIWYKNKLNFEKLKMESEMNNFRLKGLQNQMNPHFIFNLMSTIQNFILNKKEENALNFISDFSSLMRDMLDNSRKDYISLVNEIEFINRYISLELIRFENKFDIEIINTIDKNELDEIYLPTMMIQPLVENAIKHGISSLNDKRGAIKIEFSMDETSNFLKIIIEDNGKQNENKSKKDHLSSSIKILKERLQLYKKNNKIGSFEMKHTHLGTTNILIIPI